MVREKKQVQTRYYALFMQSHCLSGCYAIAYATSPGTAFNAFAKVFQGPFKLFEEDEFIKVTKDMKKKLNSYHLLLVLKSLPQDKVTYLKSTAEIEGVLSEISDLFK